MRFRFTKTNSDILEAAIVTLSLTALLYLFSVPSASLMSSITTGLFFASVFMAIALILVSLNARLERGRAIKKAISDIDRVIRNPFEEVNARRSSRLASWLERIGRKQLHRFKLNDGKIFDDMRLKLQAAGFHSIQAVYVSVAVRIMLPFLLALFGYTVAVFGVGLGIGYGAASAVVAAALSGLGFTWFLAGRRDKRVKEFVKLSPEIFDMVAIYTGAGAFFDAALESIAEEIRDISPSVASELDLFQRELALLDRTAALENFRRRNPCRAADDMAAILAQSETLGTSVTEPLSTLAASLRRDRFLEAEKRGARVPILIIPPMMLFILPTVYIVILTPVVFKFMAAF